ncbi:MAG: hypothetical protein K2X94_01750 [Amoebophilaceae bacterium]|nr:hypothetical protein [Amoebophilaceae bacterium]
MTDLIVNKRIEKRGMIGPLYIYEALFLAILTMAYFFVLVVLNFIFHVSKLWVLTCPALFFMVLFFLVFFRKSSNPTYICSRFAFYRQPKHLDTKYGTLCHKLTQKETT